MRRLFIITIHAVLGLALLTLSTGSLMAKELSEDIQTSSEAQKPATLLVYIEGKTMLPSLPIADAKEGTILSLKIEKGQATFADATKSHTLIASSKNSEIPGIVPGPLNDESLLTIANDDSVELQLVIHTVNKGSIAQLKTALPAKHPSIMIDGTYFVVINPILLPEEGVGQTFHPSSQTKVECSTQSSGDSRQWREEAEDPLFFDHPLTMKQVKELSGACFFNPFEAGAVRWQFSNPSGAGYQVKPENADNVFVPATGGVQHNIDGIYKCNQWGCWAWKVPNHCNAKAYADGSVSCCCNAAISIFKGGCRWLNSSQHGDWPDCPGC